MILIVLVLICVALALPIPKPDQYAPSAPANSWIGANSFFLHTFKPEDIDTHLKAMNEANIKVVRIFITNVVAGSKGTKCQAAPDLENDNLGQYDDTQLVMIDNMLPKLKELGMKLVIAIHDRYALGTWQQDAYKKKYVPDEIESGKADQDHLDFYNNDEAKAAFKKRIEHVMSYPSKTLGKPLGQLAEVIQSFQPENESQGHLKNPQRGWACEMAQEMKKYTGNGVLISTGGVIDFDDSLNEDYLNCAAIDVISVHSYSGVDSFEAKLNEAIQKAKDNSKKLVFEEFGIVGDDNAKADFYQKALDIANKLGVPAMPWEVVDAQNGDYEFYSTSHPNTWKVLTDAAATALKTHSDVAP